MKKLLLLTGFVLLSNVPLFSQTAQAKAENEKGFAFYEKQKYEAALPLFQNAEKLDPRWAVPRYNAACVISLLYSEKPCDWEPDDAIAEIKAAIALKASYKEKMKTDPDLEAIRPLIAFQLLSGRQLSDYGDIVEILKMQVWQGPRPGVYPANPTLKFLNDDRAELRSFHLTDDGQKIDDPPVVFDWLVDHGRILLLQNTELIHEGLLHENGLTFEEGFANFDQDIADCGT